MASFKLCISDPTSGKTFQKEVKDNMANPFMGLNIGENVKGDSFEMSGYEFLITGGSDYCGFPMRKGILGMRKSLTIYRGVGFSGAGKGIKRRKTICGHKIHDRISQINLKVTKQGSKKLAEIFGKEEKPEAKEAKEEAKPKEEKKEHKAEEKHEKAKEHKSETEEAEAKEHKEEKKETKEHTTEKKEVKEHQAEEKKE